MPVSEPNSGAYPVAPKPEGSAAKSDKTATTPEKNGAAQPAARQ
jgi:hypothetical protein